MLRSLLPVLALAPLLYGCAATNLYSNDVPPGSLRLIQVMAVDSRMEMARDEDFRRQFARTGLPVAQLQDGEAVVGRIYCCGGTAEYPDRQFAFVPPSLEIEPLDIVELRVGTPPQGDSVAKVNWVTRIVQKHDAAQRQCRWVPSDPGLWMRVLYCDWMRREGWIEQTSPHHTWLKPPAQPVRQ